MPELRCIVRDKDNVQCSTVIEVLEPVADVVKYVCRYHPASVQRAAAGNAKVSRPEVHFQDCQHDYDLKRGRAPVGTEHIQNQGSNVLTPVKIHTNRPDWNRE